MADMGDAVAVDAIETLADIAGVHAALSPDAPAVAFGEHCMTFAELEAYSEAVADALCAEGFAAQTNAAVLDRNSAWFFPILFGAAKAAMSLVTVNFRLSAPEAGFILDDSDAEIVFVGAEFLPVVEAARARLPRLKRVVVIDAPSPDGLAAWMAGKPARSLARAPSPQDRAVQMYTSGTTGDPKGVPLTHAAMICAAREGLSLWTALYAPGAAVLGTMPLFHISAANLCLAGLYAGARAEILRESDPESIARIIAERKITVTPLPPALIHDIIRLPTISTFDFSTLDTLLIAGSGIAVELLRAAQDTLSCGFALSYGMTECCGGLTYLGPADCTPDAGVKLASAGRAFGANRIRIVGPDGADLGVGEVGEILCQSLRVMTGYWKQPAATTQALRGGWYHSGDAGYLDADGYLFVVDRLKDMVISGGENIYPAEIERALRRHKAVDDVAVIGVPDAKWGEALLACIIPRADARPTETEFIAFLRDVLAGYKIPRRYAFMDAFPRNASGKVLKRELRRQYSPTD